MIWISLAATALVMGLVGGPHCLAMCAAPCNVISTAGARAQPVLMPGDARRAAWRMAWFHLGRLAGYASLGAVAALAMGSLAWLTDQTTALHPLWTLMHVAMMAWGLALMLQARQPAWLEAAGRSAWRRVQPWVSAPGGSLFAGYCWALMPCGLLYSAVLVAALSGGVWQGALSMAAFGVGTGLWLVGAAVLWRWSSQRMNALRGQWGTRVAGLMLAGVAAWALWMDLIYKPSLWCR